MDKRRFEMHGSSSPHKVILAACQLPPRIGSFTEVKSSWATLPARERESAAALLPTTDRLSGLLAMHHGQDSVAGSNFQWCRAHRKGVGIAVGWEAPHRKTKFGVDVVERTMFASATTRDHLRNRLAHRVLTEHELASIPWQKDGVIEAIVALKEAAAKALRPAVGVRTWKDVTVASGKFGYLTQHGHEAPLEEVFSNFSDPPPRSQKPTHSVTPRFNDVTFPTAHLQYWPSAIEITVPNHQVSCYGIVLASAHWIAATVRADFRQEPAS